MLSPFQAAAAAASTVLWVTGCGNLKPASDKPDLPDSGAVGDSDASLPDAVGDETTTMLPGWPPCPTVASGASVFVVDGTGRLFSFDSAGNSVGSVAAPTPIGVLNGGGIALASGAIYVTIGQPSNSVASFDLGLAPNPLDAGSFPVLSVPRGIAFDCHDDRFVVVNGGADVKTFTVSGAPALLEAGAFKPFYGPSGVAYDPDDHAIWIANYPGFPTTKYGIAEFDEQGTPVQTFAPATQFVPPGVHLEPYSIAVCSKAATGDGPLVIVGFLSDNTKLGTPAVQAYTIDGAPKGPAVAGTFTGPYGLSCDSRGRLFVADGSGLQIVDLGAEDAGPMGGFAGLKAPILGVLAAD
jgi:hypothetical protein